MKHNEIDISRRAFLQAGAAVLVGTPALSLPLQKNPPAGQPHIVIPRPQPVEPVHPAKVIVNACSVKGAAFVMDADTGEILHGDCANDLRHPASMTKIMTVYLAFRALRYRQLELGTMMPVSEHAAHQARNNLSLRAGQELSVEDAIKAMLVFSANDAAAVLAERLGITEETFAASMTDMAHQLGMKNTVFRNASGLPDDKQVTTARDMAILMNAILRDFPEYAHYFKEKDFPFRGLVYERHDDIMYGHDGKYHVDPDPRVIAAKTGFVDASGFNIVVAATDGGRNIITVVMGEPTAAERAVKVKGLLDVGFTQPRSVPLPKPVIVAALAP